MASLHQFGGEWTEEKLVRLRKYLDAYVKIFERNERASYFRTMYVDAFAGTGQRDIGQDDTSSPQTLPLEDFSVYDEDAQSFQKGSARIALETKPSFDHYVFIEQKADFAQDLENLRSEFPALANRIDIKRGEANGVLQAWCAQVDWKKHRAVVFLDPYGMAVHWDTLARIAHTQAIDMWLLFPLGQAVNRLLTRDGPPPDRWADRLTSILGTTEWRDAFYQPRGQRSMFDDDEVLVKSANFRQIGEFFLERLRTIFVKVADNPLYLYNSKNVPIYLLCFAAGNPRGASTAVKIARDILGK